MNKIREREHKFRLLFFNQYNSDIELYFDSCTFIDEDNNNYCFTVEDVSDTDKELLINFVKDFINNKDVIEQKIESQLTKWNLSRIGKCEATILKLATYEMFFDKNVDTSLAINEAVELAKSYGEEKSPSFINGVLSDIYKAGCNIE